MTINKALVLSGLAVGMFATSAYADPTCINAIALVHHLLFGLFERDPSVLARFSTSWISVGRSCKHTHY